MRRWVILILFFGIISGIIGICSAYTPPSYNSVNLTLETPYTPPSYNSVNLTLGEEGGEPDTNFQIWNGANWVEYNDTNYIEFRCTPTQTNCEPTNQNTGTSQSIFKITNNRTASGNVNMRINQTFTGKDLKCDDDYTSDGATTLTTTYQQIHGTLTNGNSVYVSCWADYNNPTSGGIFEVYANITN